MYERIVKYKIQYICAQTLDFIVFEIK